MIDGFLALYLFMLAAFTGHEIISRVPVILHTPLMSGSNFVHGIVLVGAMIALGEATTPLQQVIGFIGVFLGAGNAAGDPVSSLLRSSCSRRPTRRCSPPAMRPTAVSGAAMPVAASTRPSPRSRRCSSGWASSPTPTT